MSVGATSLELGLSTLRRPRGRLTHYQRAHIYLEESRKKLMRRKTLNLLKHRRSLTASPPAAQYRADGAPAEHSRRSSRAWRRPTPRVGRGAKATVGHHHQAPARCACTHHRCTRRGRRGGMGPCGCSRLVVYNIFRTQCRFARDTEWPRLRLCACSSPRSSRARCRTVWQPRCRFRT